MIPPEQAARAAQMRAHEKDMLDLRDAISAESASVHHSCMLARETRQQRDEARADLKRACDYISKLYWAVNGSPFPNGLTKDAMLFVAEQEGKQR